MNLEDLKYALNNLGIRKDAYSLENKFSNEAYCLTHVDNIWEVFYSERGNKNNCRKFENESDACDYFYSKITSDSVVMRNRTNN